MYKTWDNFKHDFREARLELRETGGTIDELGFHNDNAMVDQMMARLPIDKDEQTATATQHSTKLSYVNHSNATMEYQMHTLLARVQALYLANTPNYGKFAAADAAADMDAAPVGVADVDDHQLSPLRSTAGPTETAHTAANNAHTLPTDTRRMHTLRI